jgi:hypothetical protein
MNTIVAAYQVENASNTAHMTIPANRVGRSNGSAARHTTTRNPANSATANTPPTTIHVTYWLSTTRNPVCCRTPRANRPSAAPHPFPNSTAPTFWANRRGTTSTSWER